MSLISNKSLDTLLNIWIKYALESFENTDYTKEDVESRKNVIKSLNKLGVEHIEIFNINESSCTIRFTYCGIKVMKNFKLMN